jgi:hypothetical protein
MALDDVIIEAIHSAESEDASKISRDIKRDFGTFIPPVTIRKILVSRTRMVEHNKVRDKASEGLEKAAEVMETVSDELLEMFHDGDGAYGVKMRLEAVKELRQWLKLGIDTSGLHDADSNTLFVVQSDWDMTYQDE